jgi:murein DD-endopeptidase MepM/ murein hydrolase activator NlpD
LKLEIELRLVEFKQVESKFVGIAAVALLLVIAVMFGSARTAGAQDSQPDRPVYVVKEGDSLWEIANRFGVSLDDLTSLNGISDPNQVSAGTQLMIPGLEGIQGILTTKTVPYGENLRSLSRQYRVPTDILARLNHITSPEELYAGYTLVLPESGSVVTDTSRAILNTGQSLLELSVLHDTNLWKVVGDNNLAGSWQALPGDPLLLSEQQNGGPGGLPGEITGVEVSPLPLRQGKTSEIKVTGDGGLKLDGALLGHKLNFFEDSAGSYVALQGVHAMTESGLYPMTIRGTLEDTTPFTFTQNIWVQAVDYPYDQPLTVNPTTIDPAVTRPEDAQWTALNEPVTPERFWFGDFKLPSPLGKNFCLETNECWSSKFGNRRSYNGSPYNAFHTGLDIVGGTGTKIFAPAPGVVVFAGPLTVRGNATVIDHGWGVYTGYMHQSEIYVNPGDRVETGDVIGLVGGTGRVEGPHLHWEVWVGGVQVDPMDWLTTAYP